MLLLSAGLDLLLVGGLLVLGLFEERVVLELRESVGVVLLLLLLCILLFEGSSNSTSVWVISWIA